MDIQAAVDYAHHDDDNDDSGNNKRDYDDDDDILKYDYGDADNGDAYKRMYKSQLCLD